MPLILKNAHNRLAFRFGRQSGIRSTSDAIDQLEAQLRAERAQHAFDVAELEREKAILLRDLLEARHELARRDRVDAFVRVPSPSVLMH